MTTLSENVFDALALARKSKKSVIHSSASEDKDDKQDDATSLSVSNSEPTNGDETSWTVQSSTKRRLAPQYTLSKNDLGVDSPKNKAALQEISKKKVQRFSREEILALRVPTKVLPELVELTDIISVEALPPVTSFPFDFEDFNRIWNAGNANKDALVRSRVSGRVRGGKNGDDGDGGADTDNWVQGQDKGDLWDSSNDHNTISEGFDLSDFAAMADKFRNDTKDLVNSKLLLGNDEESYLKIKMREDEAMERLLREQSESEGLDVTTSDLLLADDLLPTVEEDDEEVPDWAKEDSEVDHPHDFTIKQEFTSDLKRNILLETLNVKSIPELQHQDNRVETVSKSVILPPNLDTSPEPTSNKALGSPSPFSFQAEDPLTVSSPMASNTNAGDPPSTTASAILEPTAISVEKLNPQAKSSLETTYLSTVDLSHVLGDLFAQQNVNAPVTQTQQVALSAIPAASTALPVPTQSVLQGQPDMWEYLDPQNAVQGPFTSKGMRRWLESGYFKMDLPVRLKGWSRFYPLGIVYSNIDTAFQQLMPEPISEQRRQQVMLEQQREQALLEQQRQQALLEQQREQAILEQRRQQALLEQQREQAILEQRRQQIILEQQREQALLEQQRVQAIENQRRERAKLEQQMHQAHEQQRHQQAILEQQRQQILVEQQKQQALLEQQRHEQQRQQTLLEQKKLASSATAAPWIDKVPKSQQKSLVEIQTEEEKLAERKQIQSKEQIPMSMKLKSLLGVTVSGITSSNSNSMAWTAAEKANQLQPTKPLKDIQLEEALEMQKQQQILQQQQQLYQKRLQHQKYEEQADAAAAAAASTPSITPSWAGQPMRASRTAAPFKTASLKDIMLQEENQLETEDSNGRNSNSWAAKIAVPTSPVSSPRREFTGTATTAASQINTEIKSSSAALATSDSKRTAISKVQSIATSTQKSLKSEFGGKGMSADLEEFCVNSMQKLNGSDDITLLQFCMSLKSPVEVREYLAAYLGSKPEVSQFATEFIKRKEGSGGSGTAGSTIVNSSTRLATITSAQLSSALSSNTKSATTSVNSGSDKSVPKKTKKAKSEN